MSIPKQDRQNAGDKEAAAGRDNTTLSARGFCIARKILCYHGWMTKNEKRNSKHDIMFNNQEKQESKESFSHAILTSNAHFRQRVKKVTKSEGQKQQNAIKEADGQSVNGE